MLLMKTEKVTLPMYGSEILLKGKLIKDPKATGFFLPKTLKPCERELAFFVPDKVEGRIPNGYDTAAPCLFIIDAAELVKNGCLDLFKDPAAAEKIITDN